MSIGWRSYPKSNKGLKCTSARMCDFCSRDYTPKKNFTAAKAYFYLDYTCPWCRIDNFRKGLRIFLENKDKS